MIHKSAMNDFTPVFRGGSRLHPLAFFVAVAVSGNAMAAESQPLELDAPSHVTLAW